MKLILFATIEEALPTIDALEANPWDGGQAFLFSGGVICVSGIGSVPAAAATARYITGADEVWNYGVAGCLKGTLPQGEFLEISEVGKHIPQAGEIGERARGFACKHMPSLKVADNGAKLITSDYPIDQISIRDELAKDWDIVDMEAYGITFVAKKNATPCSICKLISDHASPETPQSIQERMPELAKQISEHIVNRLAKEKGV